MNDDLTLDLDSRQPEPDVPAPRDTWGRFKLLGRVGYGGFGEVYRAWDPDLEREVALKLLLPSPAGDSKADGQSGDEYQAMLREARALASVRHPNIVPVYGIDRHDGRVGFWTDFVKGRTLSSVLGSQGPFGYREAALIGLDVTRAMSAVHRAGILHRDIKAENVMREEGGRILLMDFGLSTLPHRQTDSAGTPSYMALELWQGKAATVETDIYAVGVLLFYLVTGEYPAKLGGLSRAEAIDALTKRRTLMDLRSDLPEPFLRAVSKASETEPTKRFRSAGQLSEALAECLGTAVPVEAETKRPAGVKAGARRRLAVVAGTLVALAALGTEGYKSMHRQLPGPQTALAAGASPGVNDEYSRATELLKKSYKDSNVAEAVMIFQHILGEDKSFALAYAGLGAAYFKQYKNEPSKGDLLDSAKAATDKALGLDPDCAPAFVTRAQIEAISDHTDLAITDAKRAIKLDHRSAEAHAALGEVYQSQGKTKEATEEISKAVDLAPLNSMWPLRLGHYYMVAGNLKDAATQWESAVKLDPQNAFAWYNLGLVGIRTDRLADARANCERALNIQPDRYTFRAIGSVFQLQGDYKSAAEMYLKAITYGQSDYQSWASLASVYEWSGGDRSKMLQTYRKAIFLAEDQLRKTPEDVELLADLANFYASIGDTESSLRFVLQAVAMSPDDPNIAYVIGSSYELTGDRAKATEWFAKALVHGVRNNEFQRNPEFANLRGDPTFASALEKARAEYPLDNKAKLN